MPAALWMNPRSPPTAARQRELHLGRSVHLNRRLFIVARVPIRLHAVLVSFHREVSLGASQFNREYRRFFGQPPIRDTKAIREGKVVAMTAT